MTASDSEASEVVYMLEGRLYYGESFVTLNPKYREINIPKELYHDFKEATIRDLHKLNRSMRVDIPISVHGKTDTASIWFEKDPDLTTIAIHNVSDDKVFSPFSYMTHLQRALATSGFFTETQVFRDDCWILKAIVVADPKTRIEEIGRAVTGAIAEVERAFDLMEDVLVGDGVVIRVQRDGSETSQLFSTYLGLFEQLCHRQGVSVTVTKFADQDADIFRFSGPLERDDMTQALQCYLSLFGASHVDDPALSDLVAFTRPPAAQPSRWFDLIRLDEWSIGPLRIDVQGVAEKLHGLLRDGKLKRKKLR